MPKSFELRRLHVAVLVSCLTTPWFCSAGILAAQFRRNQALSGLISGLHTAREDDEIMRDLAVMDLYTVAELQRESGAPLDLDREDRRALARHWLAFSPALIGGRFARQFKFNDAATALAWDERERATWRKLDDVLDDSRAEALRKAFPPMAAALRSQIAGVRSAYLVSDLAASSASDAVEKFGGLKTVLALLRVRWQVAFSPQRVYAAMATTHSLIGLARYLRVAPDSAFCEANLRRTPAESRGSDPEPT